MRKIVIPSQLKLAKAVADEVLAEARDCTYCQEMIFALKLALEEALINAIKHGNGCDPAKKVAVEFDVKPECATVRITDEGKGFRPAELPDPTADENLECPCGRGVMLMRAYMDEVEYNNRGNAVRMVKYNS